jgi:hypothetical protein
MTLAETMALFYEAVTAAEPLAAERIERCFSGTPALPAPDRLAIYAQMYLGRLVDGLRQTFPCVAGWLGEERFSALAEDYVRRHPSEHHDIGQVGRHLASFLVSHPDPDRPDLADLAALEWARQEVFFAPAADRLEAGGLVRLLADDPGRTALPLSPALRVIRLAHDVLPAWRQLEAGMAPGPALPGEAAVAVWRVGYDVVHGPIPPEEAAALEAAFAGASIAEVLAPFGALEAPAVAAHAALSSWLAEGWIVEGEGAGRW